MMSFSLCHHEWCRGLMNGVFKSQPSARQQRTRIVNVRDHEHSVHNFINLFPPSQSPFEMLSTRIDLVACLLPSFLVDYLSADRISKEIGWFQSQVHWAPQFYTLIPCPSEPKVWHALLEAVRRMYSKHGGRQSWLANSTFQNVRGGWKASRQSPWL